MANQQSTEEAEQLTKTSALMGFVNETKGELAKIVWPTREQLLSESVAVLLMVVLVATVIYLIDNLFSFISARVFG